MSEQTVSERPSPAVSERPLPADQAHRDRISTALDETLFVEAGAGSGKTTALVSRVLALVVSGTAELESIAAITFTEKAGAELRDRVRRELQRTAGSEDEVVAGRCRAALDQLDGSAIGTLHAFAQRLLSEHPIEAELPPRVEVLDDVTSGVEYDARWGEFREELLADPSLRRTLLLLFATGVKSKALDALAAAFETNWDLVADRVAVDAPEPPTVQSILAPALVQLDAVCAQISTCTKHDGLAGRLDELARYADRLRAIDDELDLVEALGDDAVPKAPSFKAGNVGSKANWPNITALRGEILEAGAALQQVHGAIGQACAKRVAAALRTFTLRGAQERRAAGRLAYHDLLVLARSLLRHPEHGAGVRRHLHERYQRLLLDEFQDTDPIQIELAVRIAAADPGAPESGSAPWNEVPVTPGQLFVVGDPKQSIYRFRRADIATFLKARKRFGPEGGGVVELTANFRSTAPVIDWVNHVFAALMSEPDDVESDVPSQPTYLALRPSRPAPPTGAPVTVVGRSSHPRGTGADNVRLAEARDVAAAIVGIISDGWTVADETDGGELWRPARLGDITVLVPARTSLPFLQDAFDHAGIPMRAESSSLVYATRAVRDLLMVVRAVDDPTNHLHVVSALRTPLLGCGDDDLYRFKVERKGRWSYVGEQPDTMPADDPVAAGLAYLRSLHDERHWIGPSDLIDRIARDRRVLELGFSDLRPRDVWRRIRFIVDQARAWSDATGGSLRDYVAWVDQQAKRARVEEAILPETDDDAVRVMTIHAAKGLEFPITIVSGMSTGPGNQTAAADVMFPPTGAPAYRFGKYVQTEEWADWAPVDEQMGLHERIRLLYVACTRARDHLVVSLHREARANEPRPKSRTNAELLLAGMGESIEAVPDAVDGSTGPPQRLERSLVAPPAPLMSLDEWRRSHQAALAGAARAAAVAATALTDEGGPDPASDAGAGLQKRQRDLDLPPWMKGRYGTAVGRAVHGVLQTIDLATGSGLDAAVAAQCEAEAVPDRVVEVRRLVEQALAAPSVRAAGANPHWREVYACTPVAGRLLEGYVDLLYRGPDGLVVVDYKTAATSDPADIDRRVAGYRLQGASYALTVAAATGEPVVRVVFLFLTPSGAVERELDDLAAAVAQVGGLVAAGQELTVTESDLTA